MNKIRKYLAMAALAAAVSACSDSEGTIDIDSGQRTDSDVAIGLSAAEVSSPEDATGTRTPIESVDMLAAQGGFGVFCYYTGTTDFKDMSSVKSNGVVMDNFQVVRASSVWSYASGSIKQRYWPSAQQKLTFMSYAPYIGVDGTLTKGNMKLSKASGQIPSIHYKFDETAANLSDEDDLLWGTNEYGNAQTNLTTATNPTGYANIYFRHALTKVQPNITFGGTLTDDTRIVIESVIVDNMYQEADLSLYNTASNRPNWSGKDGTQSYSFSGSNLNANIAYNGSTLSDNFSIDGATSTARKLLANTVGNNGSFLMIPILETSEDRSLKFTVVYHEMTRSGSEGSYTYTDGGAKTVTSTLSDVDLLGDRFYRINLNLSATDMTLTIEVLPWEVEESAYEDAAEGGQLVAVNVNDTIKWRNDSIYTSYDRLNSKTGYVYVNYHTAELSFNITSPKGATWRASLVPSDVFEFVGDAEGTTGERGTLRIKVKNDALEATTDKLAVLHIYVTLSTGNVTVARNLVQGHDYTEYTVVQQRNQ